MAQRPLHLRLTARPNNRLRDPKSRTRKILGPEDDYSGDRKSTRLNSSHQIISYAVFCLQKQGRCAAAPHPPAGGWLGPSAVAVRLLLLKQATVTDSNGSILIFHTVRYNATIFAFE